MGKMSENLTQGFTTMLSSIDYRGPPLKMTRCVGSNRRTAAAGKRGPTRSGQEMGQGVILSQRGKPWQTLLWKNDPLRKRGGYGEGRRGLKETHGRIGYYANEMLADQLHRKKRKRCFGGERESNQGTDVV